MVVAVAAVAVAVVVVVRRNINLLHIAVLSSRYACDSCDCEFGCCWYRSYDQSEVLHMSLRPLLFSSGPLALF